MKTILVIALSLLLLACGRRDGERPALKKHSEKVIFSDSRSEYTLKTFYTKGLIGLPVWQIFKKEGEDDSPKCLFTVERVWQESEPGPPILQTNGAKTVFSDSLQSYEFSISSNTFTTNRWSQSVYTGEYRTKLKIEP